LSAEASAVAKALADKEAKADGDGGYGESCVLCISGFVRFFHFAFFILHFQVFP